MTVYRTAGVWGPGKGSNLTPVEVDENFFELRDDLDNVIANPPAANGIASITASGTSWTVTLTNGESNTLPIPVLQWRWRGEWTPLTIYDALDGFSVDGYGLFSVLVDHISAATFDPDAIGGSPATPLYNLIVGVGTNAGLDDLTDVDTSGAVVGDVLGYTGSPPFWGPVTPAAGDFAGLTDVGVTGAAADDFVAYDGADWTNRTPVEATALLIEFEGDTGSPGGGVKGLVPAPADGDAAAGKVLGAGGEWVVASTVGALDDLSDVTITAPQAGDLLGYSDSSPAGWANVTPTAISGLPAATLPLDLASLIEVSEASGSPAVYASAQATLADLLDAGEITLGSTAIALGSTVITIAGLTLVTPALGTPASGVLTNATGLPVSTGIAGLGTGVATALAVNIGSAGAPVVFNGALGTPSSGTLTNATGLPISTGLAGAGTGVLTALAVNIGSAGAFLVNGGALGTPASGTLTNATGLPVSTGISGLGTGVATFLATPSSANLAAAVTGETGSGALVFGAGPTIDALTLTGNTTFAASGRIDGTNGWIGIGGAPSSQFQIGGNVSSTAWGLNAIIFRTGSGTYTDTTSSGTVANAGMSVFRQPTIAASSVTTFTQAANVYIANAPAAGTNVTLTNPMALWIDAGKVRIDDMVMFGAAGSGTPALISSSAELRSRLADDSAYADFAAANLISRTAGKGLQLQSGTGARAGDATLVAGTVAVTNTTVTANTKVLLSRKTIGGTVGNLSYTLSAGASFTISSSSATDTSVITYMLVELN